MVPTRRTRRPAALALVLLGACTAPGAAQAAGFSQPIVVSGKDTAERPQVAIAPNGRTAVLYTRDLRRGGKWRTEYRAAIGPSADRLAPPVTVAAGRRAAESYGTAQLLAQPGGGFAACFSDGSGRRTKIDGCSFASPTGGFGPLVEIQRTSRRTGASMRAVQRPDGSLVFLLSRYRDGRTAETGTWTRVLGADGQLGAEQPFDDKAVGLEEDPAVLADGTVAIPTAIPVKGKKGEYFPGVRLMAPGADRFGPPVAVSSERSSGYVSAFAGRELLVRFSVAVPENADYGDYDLRVVRVKPDLTSDPSLAYPGGRNTNGPLLSIPSGGLLAITGSIQTDPADSDCFNPVSGQVGAGAPGAPGQANLATPLSTPGQIAQFPAAAVLDDGTVIATWENAGNTPDYTRLEVAIREPGATAFSAPRVLPRLTMYGGSSLGTGGNHAALAWRSRDAIVVSSLRSAGPYAKFTRRPTSPVAPCDE